ncbi:MAG: 30S ribosomal protein S8 [Chloroflexi bacterium]|nr:30S ribosomal protein S8 [Chloroflexota bacterium]MCL5074957.1 30S ribosomal protein S8 [Chloroflexota bacterium]
MNITDPIADMLTRIRNAIMAKHEEVLIPASHLKISIAKILKEEGFIKDYEVFRDNPQGTLRIWLSYTGRKQPLISEIKRVSKPGLRVYAKSSEMPRIKSGRGIAIVSTPKGVMTAQEARRQNVGGEVLCYIW